MVRSVAYSDWVALYQKSWKVQLRWAMVVKVLTNTGATLRAQGMLYKAVVQSVLLYGRNSWLMMEAMLKILEWLSHWLAIRITGMTARRTTSGEWEGPPVADTLETTGIWTIEEYIQYRQATIAVQVTWRTIYKLLTDSERIPGASRFMRWWYQDVGREVECPGYEYSFKT